jgi:hypothetical protein
VITIDRTNDPEAALDARLDEFTRSGKTSDGFALDYSFIQEYLPGAPALGLIAVVAFKKVLDGVRVALSIMEKSEALLSGLHGLEANWDSVRRWCEQNGLVWLELDRPLGLQPVAIPKPWGREIWYTGIEVRGQSRVADTQGGSIPLPWLLSLCSRRLLGAHSRDLILLKILDPLPQPVFGDLYFEMHEEKREVYVVTHVDPTAWPDGTGGIRFGFDQEKRSASGDDDAFKTDYLAAVNAYRKVRLQIDDHLDAFRATRGIPLDAPVDPATLQDWLTELPQPLCQQEAALRCAMEAFVHVKSLQVGDVVKVPCFTPHSLLHGVRTVEFQTPVYERKILSFAQKVLTQSHWDTASALEQVSLDSPEKTDLPVIENDDHVCIEEVVAFEDFRVERLTLKGGRICHPAMDGGGYCLIMAVSSGLFVNGVPLDAEQAVLVPANTPSLSLGNAEQGEAIALLAKPQ